MKKSKAEKLATIISLAKENDVTANSIAVANNMGPYGVLKILRGETKNPQNRTIEALYTYMTSNYTSKKSAGNITLDRFTPSEIMTYIIKRKDRFESDPSFLMFEELIFQQVKNRKIDQKLYEVIEVVNEVSERKIEPLDDI